MKAYLKFLSTISLLEVLKYSILNLIFFVSTSMLIITSIFYYIMNYDIHFLKTGDYVTLISAFYALYLLTCIIFLLLYKQPTKQKLPLFILNLLFLRFSTINTSIIDFIKNQSSFGIFFWVCTIAFIGIIYYTRFYKSDIQKITDSYSS